MNSAYILENSSSEGQQTTPCGIIINGDRQESLLERGTAETQFQQIYFEFLMKCNYSFKRINCNRKSIPDCWRSYRESTFANILLRLVSGTKNKKLSYVKLVNLF